MKIAVYTDSFLPVRGGTELATYNLCKGFLELGHQVVLFCPDYHTEQTFNEFPVYRVKSISITKSDKMVLRKMEYKKVFDKTKEFAPDVIYYCTASGMTRMALDIAKKLNLPCVGTIHTKFKESIYDVCHSHIVTKVMLKSLVNKLNRTDKIVFVSHDLAEQIKQEGFKKDFEVIKNGVDYFSKGDKSVVEKEDKIINFFFCGHVIKVKNIQFSLKSLAYLKNNKNFTNFKFRIVGSGKYMKKLKRLTKKFKLNDHVEFVGYIGDKNVLANYYRNAHLFLIPSTFDNDALVILEASQSGTPSLVLKNTGSSERIIDNVNGFVSEHSIENYAEKIYEIINNKELYNKVCNNLYSIFGESWVKVAEKYQNIFYDLINKKSK